MPPSCAEPLHQVKHGKSVANDAQILLFRILRKQRLRHHRLKLRQMRRAARGISPLIFEAFDLKHGDAILKTDLLPKQ